jgi:hypothetical protein
MRAGPGIGPARRRALYSGKDEKSPARDLDLTADLFQKR